jgi:hypothetical protein
MNESEVREIASQIEAAGWGTMVPDMPVPLSTSGVPAGLPNLPGDAEDEYLMVPRQLVGYDPVVMITVHGESMCDAGIEDGDIVTMRVASTAEDGDIVVAMLDGEVTLKAFFRDESGEAWLVPQNAMYKPIRVSEFTDVRILGRVVDVRKPVGRVSYRQIQQQMRSIQRRSEEERPRLSDEVIRRAVARVVPMMTNNRQWFCIYRVLADKGVLSDGAFYELSQLVNRLFPDNDYSINAKDLSRMAVGSFSKRLFFWNEADAPVQGKRYAEYLRLAQTFQSMLE